MVRQQPRSEKMNSSEREEGGEEKKRDQRKMKDPGRRQVGTCDHLQQLISGEQI